MRINVKGGTRAGTKKPLREKSGPWECECVDTMLMSHPPQPGPKRVNPGWRVNCPDCGARRDGDAES